MNHFSKLILVSITLVATNAWSLDETILQLFEESAKPTVQSDKNGAIVNDYYLPSYSGNGASSYRESTDDPFAEFPSGVNFAKERVGNIAANVLSPNKYDLEFKKKGNDRCIVNKAELAKKKVAPKKFNTDNYNKILAQGVPADALANAIAVFDQNQEAIKNNNYITIADFGLNANRKRLFVINTQTGEVIKTYTAHGKNSDKDYNGCVDKNGFSNENGSDRSSQGFMIVGNYYSGKHGRSLMLHGMETGVNDRACRRSVVMHEAGYVPGGRSNGCPAVTSEAKKVIFPKIVGGSLYYSYPGDPGKTCVPMQKSKSKKKRSKKRRRGRRKRRR